MDLKFHYALASLLTSISTLVLSVYVYANAPKEKTIRIYSFWALTVCLWSFFLYASVYATSFEAALLWCKLLHIWATLLPATYLHFVVSFVDRDKSLRGFLNAIYAITILISTTIFTPWFITVEFKPQFDFFVSEPKILYPLHMVFFLFCICYATYEAFLAYCQASGLRKKQLQYFLIATMLGYSGGTTNYLINYDFQVFPLYPFGNYTILFGYVAVVGIAIVKYQFMDIETLIKRSLTFVGLWGILFGTFAFVTLLLPDLLVQYIPIGRMSWTLVSVFLIVALFRPLENILTTLTDRFLFQKKYDYRVILKQLIPQLHGELRLEQLLEQIVNILVENIKLDNCAIFLVHESTRNYRIQRQRGLKTERRILDREAHLVKELIRRQDTLVRTQGNSDLEGKPLPAGLVKEMAEFESYLCIPLILQNDLKGIIMLGKKKSDEDFTLEDIEALYALTSQGAIAISNAILYVEASRQSNLAALGTLAGGIHHEINNYLSSITAGADSLKETIQGYSEQGHFNEMKEKTQRYLEEVCRQAERIERVVDNLRTFARPKGMGQKEKIFLQRTADEVLEILQNDFNLRAIKIVKDYAGDLAGIWADKQQIHQVLLNIIRNAGEAIGENGVITLSIHPTPHGTILAKISDTGPGIPAHILPKIFDSYFTTKGEKGSGYGLFIAKSNVELNEGKISIKSEAGKGAAFLMEFPVCL